MISILFINNQDTIINGWLNALRNSGLAVHDHKLSVDQACQELTNTPQYDLIIYQSNESPTEDDNFFSCVESTNSSVPIIVSCDTANLALFEKYAGLGVKDIFQTQDTARMVLITHRELKVYQLSKELLQLKEQFSESESRYQNLLETSEEAIAYIQDGMHMHINPAYMAIFNYLDEDELTSKPIMDIISSNYQNYFKQFLKTASQLTSEKRIELDCVRQDGQIFKALMVFSPAVYEGENCLQLQVENLELQQKVRLVSDQDPQTGLFSRHHFMQDLEKFLSKKDPLSTELALLYILVDGFEDMKNQHGLVASDLILQEISGLLQSQIQHGMTLYRFGDHSFTLLVESNDIQQAKTLAESLIRLTSNHEYTLVPDVIAPTLSIGLTSTDVTLKDNDGQSANELLNHAYQACRDIYTNGGNGFLSYETLARQLPEEDEIEAIDDAIHLRELLAYAMEHDRFRLLYQPIVSIQGDTSENYAVLLRLLDNNNEEIRPEHFLKQAVQFGFMVDIDRWVIKHAIQEIAQQRLHGSRLNFFIQLSENAIRSDTILLWIVDCIREASAKGVWLTFQFNHPDVCDHMIAVEKLILGLKKINCNIAISQYENTDHAEQMLQRLPVDVIKLHHSVLHGIEQDESSRQQLVELNRLAQEMKIKIVAAKIEQADVLSVLWQIGINYIQGFSLQEPSSIINYELP